MRILLWSWTIMSMLIWQPQYRQPVSLPCNRSLPFTSITCLALGYPSVSPLNVVWGTLWICPWCTDFTPMISCYNIVICTTPSSLILYLPVLSPDAATSVLRYSVLVLDEDKRGDTWCTAPLFSVRVSHPSWSWIAWRNRSLASHANNFEMLAMKWRLQNLTLLGKMLQSTR